MSNGFNFTRDFLNKEYIKQSKLWDDRIFANNYVQGMKRQQFLEKKFISEYENCPQNVDSTMVRDHLSGLNPEILKNEIKEYFYNASVMEAAACIASSIINSDKNEITALTSNELLREYVPHLKQMGSPSANGYALSGELGDNPNLKAENFYVVKVPQSVINADELVHESVVAFIGTNKLRKIIPNFAYIYDVKYCSAPFIDPVTKEVIAWCNTNKNPVAYSLYENVFISGDVKSQSLRDFCGWCKAEDFMMYYLQTLLALRTGAIKCGFTHYDCHSENILLRHIDKEVFYIPYATENGYEYIKSNGFVSTFIDFGMSHVQETVNGVTNHYGHVGATAPQTENGVYRDHACPMHDAYKLLMFCLLDLKESNNFKVYDRIKPLFKYFNVSDNIDYLLKDNENGEEINPIRENNFFALPWCEEVKRLDLDQYIHYCREFVQKLGFSDPISFDIPEDALQLSCERGCPEFITELALSGVELNKKFDTPLTFVEFFESYGNLSIKQNNYLRNGNFDLAEKCKVKAKIILDHFINRSFDNVKDIEKEKLDNIVDKMRKIVNDFDNNFIVYRLPNVYEDLINDKLLNRMKESTIKHVSFLDCYQRLALGIKIGRYIQSVLNVDSKFNDLYNSYEQFLNEAKVYKNAIIKNIVANVNFLEPWRLHPDKPLTKNDKQIKQFIKDITNNEDRNLKKFLWYWNTYPAVLSMF
jgi:hypothetical protein